MKKSLFSAGSVAQAGCAFSLVGHVLATGEAAAGGRSSGSSSRAGFMATLVTLPEEHLSGYDLVLMYYCACAPCRGGDRTMRLHSAGSGGEKAPVEFVSLLNTGMWLWLWGDKRGLARNGVPTHNIRIY